jgi:hypothetical protein
MVKNKKASLKDAVSSELKKNFNLNDFKEKKLLNSNVKFKEQQWLKLSAAYQDITSTPGIPLGHVVLLRGHTDTGKTTAMIEAAIAVQKSGRLPIFIITEMKWSWEHVIQMGFEVELIKDPETGDIINYEGFFLYVDRETIHSVEDVAGFVLNMLDEQKKGNLPYDLVFLWDSVGSVPCEMSIKSNKNNNEWNAGAMSTQFGNNINQRITLSRKESQPYTNTLVCVNKVWTAKAENPMSKPKLMNKGGWAMWFDATFVVTFGNVSNSGTSKINATKNGKTVEFAKRTNIQIEKNHINGITTKGRIIMTPHGFIKDDDASIKGYKKEHNDEWARILGGTDFDIIEEEDEINDLNDFITYTEEPE